MATSGFTEPEQTTETESRPERQRKIKQAMEWLQVHMAGQVCPAADLERQALEQGIAHSTLAEARRRLSIRSEKRGAAWWWIPPKARRKKQSVTV
jgi:hypothetical protein